MNKYLLGLAAGAAGLLAAQPGAAMGLTIDPQATVATVSFASASQDAIWDEVTPNQDDVYIGMDGEVLPEDNAGYPIDNPQSETSAESVDINGDPSERIGPCTPVSGRDNPHRSSTGFAASGHGWWGQGDCSNNLAKVYNCLYMKHEADGYWYQKDCSPVKTLKPGGGSSNRTVARAECEHYDTRDWRNHVDVDVIDEWDSGEKPMREASFVCRT